MITRSIILNPISRLITGITIFYASENLNGQLQAASPQPQDTQSQTKEKTPDLNGKMNDPRFAEFVRIQLRKAKTLSEKYIPEQKEITKNPFIKTNWVVTPDVIKFLKFFSQKNPSLRDNPDFQKQLQESLDLHSTKGKDEATHGFTLVFAMRNPDSPSGFEATIITIFREGLFDTSFEDVLARKLHEDLHIAVQVNETIPNMLIGKGQGKGQGVDPIDTEITIFTRGVNLLKQIRQKERGIDPNAMDLVIEEHETKINRLKKLKSKKPKDKNQEQSYLLPILTAGGTLLLARSICMFGRRYFNEKEK